MKELTLKKVKQYAEEQGKSVVFNRKAGGYQIHDGGFTYSDIVVPHRDYKNKIYMTQHSLRNLMNMI